MPNNFYHVKGNKLSGFALQNAMQTEQNFHTSARLIAVFVQRNHSRLYILYETNNRAIQTATYSSVYLKHLSILIMLHIVYSTEDF